MANYKLKYINEGSTGAPFSGTTYNDSSIQITTSDTWTSDSTTGGYYHVYNMVGIHPESTPIISPNYTSSQNTEGINQFWSDVFKAETSEGQLKIYKSTNTASTVNFYLILKGY